MVTGPHELGWGPDRYQPPSSIPTFDEDAWWGDCVNTWHEEQKQFAYAKRMGLQADWACAHPPTYDVNGQSVLDIGGGPASLLLKCINRDRSVVADPGFWPQWVLDRYAAAGIEYWRTDGENIEGYTFDEVWIYNVLTHVRDPQKIIANAVAMSSLVRIFEWLEDAPRPGHPQTLHAAELDTWLGGTGFVAHLNEGGAVGLAYYGVFRCPS